ncbi:MAG: AhpC/TSA family protein [Dehalococcoidia bacterium]
MGQRYQEIKRAGGEVLPVSFESQDRLEWLHGYLSLPFPLLSDPSYETYRKYGLDTGSTFRVLGPRVVWAYLKLVVRGRRFRVPVSDIHQLGGDFIIGPDGLLRYAHRQRGPDDRPPIGEILSRLAGLQGRW